MTRLISGFFLVAAAVSVSSGSEVSTVSIKKLEMPVVDFAKVAVAKITAEDELTLIVPQFQEETRTRTRRITEYRTEERTKRVVNGDGELEARPYTVKVPVRTATAEQYFVKYARVVEKRVIRVDEIAVWDIRGQQVDNEIVAKRLQKAAHVFLLEKPWDELTINTFFRHVLSPNVLFVYGKTFDEREEDSLQPDPANLDALFSK